MSKQETKSSRSFRLFGRPFEVRSSLSPEEAKTALRKRKLHWLDPKTGPRGWILGSLLCLQWSALVDRGPPVLLARIVDDGVGTRVHGRVGLDLASLGLIGVIAGVVVFSMYKVVLQSADVAPLLLFGAIFVLIPGGVLWLRLVSPEESDPAVQFIRRVLETPTERSIRPVSPHYERTPVQSAKLNIDGQILGAAPSEDAVAQAILAMEPDSFLTIDFGSNKFMQTALEYDGFILEKCEGSDRELYRAKGDFERNDIIAVMTAYLRRSELSKPIVWEKKRG